MDKIQLNFEGKYPVKFYFCECARCLSLEDVNDVLKKTKFSEDIFEIDAEDDDEMINKKDSMNNYVKLKYNPYANDMLRDQFNFHLSLSWIYLENREVCINGHCRDVFSEFSFLSSPQTLRFKSSKLSGTAVKYNFRCTYEINFIMKGRGEGDLLQQNFFEESEKYIEVFLFPYYIPHHSQDDLENIKDIDRIFVDSGLSTKSVR